MRERNYGPFEHPVTISDAQWRILERVRGRTVANVGQTLSIAAKL